MIRRGFCLLLVEKIGVREKEVRHWAWREHMLQSGTSVGLEK